MKECVNCNTNYIAFSILLHEGPKLSWAPKSGPTQLHENCMKNADSWQNVISFNPNHNAVTPLYLEILCKIFFLQV